MANNTDFPEPEGARATNLKAISWYIWRGAIFRMPLLTLQSRTEEGSMDLINVGAHCHAFCLTRFRVQRYRSGSLTAEWLNVWASLYPRTNPAHIRVISRTVEYLGIYFHEWEMWNPRGRPKEGGAFKRRVFDTLRTMSTTKTKPRHLYILRGNSKSVFSHIFLNRSACTHWTGEQD